MNRFENRPKGVFQNCTNVRFPKLENVQWYAFRKYTDISFHTLISFSCFSLWRRIKASINDFSYSECFCFLWFYHRTNLPSPKNWWISGHGLSTVKRALDISSFVKLASSSATSWRYMQSVSLHCWPFKNLNCISSDELFRSGTVLVQWGWVQFLVQKSVWYHEFLYKCGFDPKSYFESGPKMQIQRLRKCIKTAIWQVIDKIAFSMTTKSLGPLSNCMNLHFWSRFRVKLWTKRVFAIPKAW